MVRVIPRLEIKGPNLVKGVHLEGLRVLGSPGVFARHYYEQGADELVYMDVVASLYGRNSLRDIIAETARELFIPLTVGGGLRTLDDIRLVLRNGADKVSLNTAAVSDPQLIKRASQEFGASTIVVSLECIRHANGEYFVYTDNGREYSGKELTSWVRTVLGVGVGEFFVTSVDRDGTGSGYDIELLKIVTAISDVPVIAYGGAGKASDVVAALAEGGADAVSMASVLHYGCLADLSAHSAREGCREGNTEFLVKGCEVPKRFSPCSVDDVKRAIAAAGYRVRP
jgi:cyclase